MLSSEKMKQLSLEGNDFYSCQNGRNSHSGGSKSKSINDTRNISDKISIAEKNFNKITMTPTWTDSRLVQVGDHNHSLSEVVVVSATIDPLSDTEEKDLLSRDIQQVVS